MERRKLTTEDLLAALEAVKPTGVAAKAYLKEQVKNEATAFREAPRRGGGSRQVATVSSPPPLARLGAAAASSPYLPTHSMRLNSDSLAGLGEKQSSGGAR